MALRENLLPIVKDKASRSKLDYRLVDAIVKTESNYDIYAVRYEPKFSSNVISEKYAKINATTNLTEQQLQKFSWGLCQIMGATARWLGFQGPLPYLCEPNTNLIWGCRYLAKLKNEYGTLEYIISAYNQGSIRRLEDGKFSNQAYVDKVLSNFSS